MKPNGDVLVTKGPGVETTGLLMTLFPDTFSDLGADMPAAVQDRFDETDAVHDTTTILTAGGRGVHAIYDAIGCSIHGTFSEVIGNADIQLEIDESSILFRPGVHGIREYLGIDPWRSTIARSPVVAANPSIMGDMVAALDAHGTPVGVAGIVVTGEDVVIDDERIEHPDMDPPWTAYK